MKQMICRLPDAAMPTGQRMIEDRDNHCLVRYLMWLCMGTTLVRKLLQFSD